MNQVEPLRLKDTSPLSGKPFCDRLGGSLFGEIVDTKYCRGCETEKSVENFYKNRSRKDGLQVYCKECQAAYRREYYSSHKKEIAAYNRAHLSERAAHKQTSRLRHPMRTKARNAVTYAIISGKLIRPDHCENPECNIECKPEAHHHNGYEPEHWLDIEFLCTECHGIADRKLTGGRE